MKIDCDLKLVDPFGRDIIERVGEPPLTIGVACSYAFLTPHPKDTELLMPEKVKMYDLATRFAKGGIVDVSDDEVDLIRNRVAAVFHVSVMGAVFDKLPQKGS